LYLGVLPLIVKAKLLLWLKRACGAGGVRQHGAQEEEAAKASWLGFDAPASGAGFEPACFLCGLCASVVNLFGGT